VTRRVRGALKAVKALAAALTPLPRVAACLVVAAIATACQAGIQYPEGWPKDLRFLPRHPGVLLPRPTDQVLAVSVPMEVEEYREENEDPSFAVLVFRDHPGLPEFVQAAEIGLAGEHFLKETVPQFSYKLPSLGREDSRDRCLFVSSDGRYLIRLERHRSTLLHPPSDNFDRAYMKIDPPYDEVIVLMVDFGRPSTQRTDRIRLESAGPPDTAGSAAP